jgi:hypothetical protein
MDGNNELAHDLVASPGERVVPERRDPNRSSLRQREPAVGLPRAQVGNKHPASLRLGICGQIASS